MSGLPALPTTRDLPALFAFLEERLCVPFAWQRGYDCTSFALGAVAVQTGVDILADYPHWTSRRSAMATIPPFGLARAIDCHMDRTNPANAMRGDVAALYDDVFGVRLMVVEGRTLVGPGTSGLERLAREEMLFAWDATTARRVAVSDE